VFYPDLLSCPTRRSSDLQVRRHGDLKRRIGGISQKMLTQTLRLLERDGLVRRSVYDVVPPRVEYALTPLGQTLLEPLRAICRWAENHLPQVKSARADVIRRATGRSAQES